MKKLIALTALATAGISLAQTTSTTEVSFDKLSILEKTSVDYFVEAQDKIAGNTADGAQGDVEMYNSISLRYRVAENITAQFNPRFTLSDAGDDRFDDHDLRVGLSGNLFSDAFATTIQYIVPTSVNTLNADETDGQIRITQGHAIDIDDMNNIAASVQFRKTFRKNVPAGSEWALLPYLSYTNKKISENITARIDYEGYLPHQEGKDILHVENEADQFNRLLVGADLSNVPGLNSVYPYLTHYPMRTKALDQTGVGVQVFKSF
ncbi:MAG: hypothetical protein CME62_04890 [Halobacteriovoraceae bacterium]|nr:hypothetical protein [Halobacteriovoraceae bacterium]|tara:strand:- start:400 stop:1191 length:792 start_codon:yes stop_codon:yes gene_type:complete